MADGEQREDAPVREMGPEAGERGGKELRWPHAPHARPLRDPESLRLSRQQQQQQTPAAFMHIACPLGGNFSPSGACPAAYVC